MLGNRSDSPYTGMVIDLTHTYACLVIDPTLHTQAW